MAGATKRLPHRLSGIKFIYFIFQVKSEQELWLEQRWPSSQASSFGVFKVQLWFLAAVRTHPSTGFPKATAHALLANASLISCARHWPCFPKQKHTFCGTLWKSILIQKAQFSRHSFFTHGVTLQRIPSARAIQSEIKLETSAPRQGLLASQAPAPQRVGAFHAPVPHAPGKKGHL